MSFQILNSNNEALSLSTIDQIACEVWDIPFNPKKYANPTNTSGCSWFNVIGYAIASLSSGNHKWEDVIGELCRIQALGETNTEDFMFMLLHLKPYLDLIFEFQKRGLKPVTL